jgi:uncharacterized C2H2 Zn-finger protein
MVEYTCESCLKKFSHKTDYLRHINKKKKCNSETINNINDNRTDCTYCGKKFTRKYDMQRHISNNCIAKKKLDEDTYKLNVIQLDQQKMIEELTIKLQQLEQLNNKPPANFKHSLNNNNNDHSVNNTNSHNTNNNITINVAAYGHENISHITDDDYKKIFKLCNSSVPEFIKLKHFDKNHPENSNVYIPNLTGSHGFMYDGEQWNAIEKRKLLTYLYDDGCDCLIDKYNAMKLLNINARLGRFDKFIDKHEENKVVKETSKAIELIAYNYKDLAKAHKKNKN